MSNHVIMVRFYDSAAKRITKLANDAHIYLKPTPDQGISYHNVSMDVPVDDLEWNDDFVEKYMKVFRVAIEARHTFMAVFDDVSPVKTMKIAITKFRKPTKADLQYSVQSGKKSYLFNTTDEDKWYYVGFLPDENEIKKMAVHNGSRSRRNSYEVKFNDDYTISLYVYFLGDNLEDDLYAYLLIVRTGPYQDCGTTSNIVIQLFGAKNDSRPHVLNYPDPDLAILQNGSTELLVLTTKHHLGDITSIELWYDAIGSRYTWLCESVKIYDLQTRDSWFFDVEKRFSVSEEGMDHYTVLPSSEDKWIITLKLMHVNEFKDAISTVIFVVFCLLILKLVLKFTKKIIKNGLRTLLRWAELWELTIIVTNITIVYQHLLRYHRHHNVFRRLCDAKHNEFVPYFALMNSYELLQAVSAILFAFAIARGLSFMKFMRPFRIFEKTIRLGLNSYVAIIVFDLLVLTAFGISGHLMFGGYSGTFTSLPNSVVTLVKAGSALRSEYSAKNIEGYNRRVAHAFHAMFSISVKVLKSLIIVTMLIFYYKSKIYIAANEYPYSLKKYFSERWTYYSELTKRQCLRCRLKAGEDSSEVSILAVPKEDKFRYADAVFISDAKLRYMTLLCSAITRKIILKKMNTDLTPIDFDLMRRISLSYFKIHHQPTHLSKCIFFIKKHPNGKRSFVSNNKLLQIENILNDVLSKSGALHKTGFKDTTSCNRLQNISEMLETVDQVLGNITVISVKRSKMHKI
ncbi:polycystin family member [Holotrichia oblita]|uniref:Polycystin family member n=1 Tax=Holotrichia oblita TaxID=644536 RepID=A0ACB9T1Q5_HOLOL|nr:polycystin family member [Holotrichia oblita]